MMNVECVCFWLLVWVCLELTRTQYASLQLSLTLTAILSLVCLLTSIELDLLALVILATYASVFIALALLALHFGPFWLRAAHDAGSQPTPRRSVVLLALIGGAGLLGLSGAWASTADTGVWALALLWQDFGLDLRVRVGGYVGLTHWLFFRLFVLETLGLNLYLFIGLVVALGLLAFRYSWLDAANLSSALPSPRGGIAQSTVVGDRLRVVTKFRRQVRRTNASRLRHANAR